MKQAQAAHPFGKFVYIDSSQEEETEGQQRQGRVLRECLSDQQLPTKDYQQQLQQIVQNQIARIEYGDQLMVQVNDKPIQQAFQRKKEKYRYFLKQMQIDANYNAAMGNRVAKLKTENHKKEQVLANKRMQEQNEQQQCQLRRVIVRQQDQQQKTIKGVQKTAHQLGVERNVLISNKVKSDVQAERTATDHQLVSLRNRQRNQLQELRDRYEEIKVAERVNRLGQEKALKELQSGNKVLKGQVKTKLVIKKEFII